MDCRQARENMRSGTGVRNLQSLSASARAARCRVLTWLCADKDKGLLALLTARLADIQAFQQGGDMKKITPVLAAAAAVFSGCTDASSPAFPDVAGLFEWVEVAGPATCSPTEAAAVLDATLPLAPITFTGLLRIRQSGELLTWEAVEIEGTPINDALPITVAMDPGGSFVSEQQLEDQFTIHYPNSPDRTFYHQLTGRIAGRFDLQARPLRAILSGTVLEVFREGSQSAPVFATCTTPRSGTWTRVSQ